MASLSVAADSSTVRQRASELATDREITNNMKVINRKSRERKRGAPKDQARTQRNLISWTNPHCCRCIAHLLSFYFIYKNHTHTHTHTRHAQIDNQRPEYKKNVCAPGSSCRSTTGTFNMVRSLHEISSSSPPFVVSGTPQNNLTKRYVHTPTQINE